MRSICRVLVFALAAASCFTPVHVPEFCQGAGPDCHSHDDTASDSQPPPRTVKSRWNISVSDLIQALDQFRVSCKKLIEAFPIDEVDGNFVRTVKNCIFSKSIPTPLKGPLRLAAVSEDVITGILDLDVAVTQSEDFLHYASGGRLLIGSVPLAHRYGGHQFGYWAGQLGDGRAHFLGQYSNRKGEIWELQLKGSGKTPYSRSGDGRAVIRSSVREFLCSEAMHFLGVPTSRAASLIVSEELVLRDQFYSGDVKTERGAVVLRLAKSWFRIGSLEILAQSAEIDLLRKLLNFVIDEHFPSISSSHPDKYLVFFSTVVNETANLIGQWMSVGFAHGVCNTDNFSLLSITIDYGPFGFMESYNPNFVPNTSDDEGRYSIGAQANVGLFNLEKLLGALSPVLTQKQQKEAKMILKGYVNIYQMRIHQIFKAKLGLLGEEEEDSYIIAFLLQMMEDTQSDFTMTFRQLSEVSDLQLHDGNFTQMWALDDLSLHKHFTDWVRMYLLRVSRQRNDTGSDRQNRMRNVNPRYVLRNWMAESAIRKAEMNDFSEVAQLHHILSSPFVTQETAEEAGYAARPPLWAERLKVSCSS
ncbi:protein adenylyltransferase SelO-like [Xiphias gladius]|uniref:protein adenylyltransferase SelO-like n=1 Tax=Xiphias gladius TaxID=8245 RepID=UPI001A9969CE|nr:protein adenylyltransferase SelO-like [Xiphias gladius]XP_039982560.1 protein adenylyltransferase SelO-like [Xiphias gladius]XP_039982562.1 protein adenylyltransferase SelO-like [Xiphias gladius]XP_039982563.1 protein adenylyltransferase SelO-like [Xiphias gladius]